MSDSFNVNYDLSNFLRESGFDNDNDNDSEEEDFCRDKAKIGKKKYWKAEAWVVANEFGNLKDDLELISMSSTASDSSTSSASSISSMSLPSVVSLPSLIATKIIPEFKHVATAPCWPHIIRTIRYAATYIGKGFDKYY